MIVRYKFLGAILCILPILGTAPSSKAQGKPIIAIMSVLPFGYLTVKNEMTGFYHDLSRLVEHQAGVDFKHALLAPPRAARSFSSGEIDFVVTGASSKPFQNGKSLGILGCHNVGIMTHKGAQINSIQSLKGKRIGVITGGYIDRKYSSVLGYDSMPTGTAQSLVSMLFRNRVDGIFLTDLMFLGYAHDPRNRKFVPQNWEALTGPFIVIEKFEIVLRVSNVSQYQKYSDRLKMAVEKVREDGRVAKVYRRYAPELNGSC